MTDASYAITVIQHFIGFTSCIYSRPLWTWRRRRIARRLDVAADDTREETFCFLDLTAFPVVKQRAVVWLHMSLIDLTVNTPTPLPLT
ncbi:hypothetical protein PR048_004269 [Dryococelus australis]|uniref:Uncharacterized protein n=1 Tax=Dryococelus australis TaxID=614101 RepID=A0ABQ9I514_9NEOP|nr:hypothetical protein PR048_004269 [Dryococelus australis]